MNPVRIQHQALIAVGLCLAMLATRFHHFGSAVRLPDASTALFFAAGFYVTRRSLLPALMLLAAAIDYVAITHGGVSSFCVTPAYAFLVPAYAALWLGGRWSARRASGGPRDLLAVFKAAVLSGGIAFMISNGAFYALSGRFANLSWAEYAARVARYWPPYMGYLLMYVTIMCAMHGIVTLLRRTRADAPADPASHSR